jgi:hypothetical protein
VKHKLVQPILKVVFWAVSILPVNEEEEYFSRYTDARTVMTCAAVQALNKLAVYLSPEELLPFLVCCITFKFLYLWKQKNFSMSCIIQTSCEAHPASYPVGTQGSFSRVKWLGNGAHHSPPSSAEVKSVWIYTSS